MRRVLLYECLGFAVLILLCWLGEEQQWPQYLFGPAPQTRDWRDSATETLLILCIWALVYGLTKRLVNHLHHLEGLIRICAWCRKVGHQERWINVEQYFAEGLSVQATHGMCPECYKKLEEETREFKRKEMVARVISDFSARSKNPATAPCWPMMVGPDPEQLAFSVPDY